MMKPRNAWAAIAVMGFASLTVQDASAAACVKGV